MSPVTLGGMSMRRLAVLVGVGLASAFAGGCGGDASAAESRHQLAGRSREVDVEWARPVWLDSKRIAVPGPRRRSAVFDRRLRRHATLPGWDTPLTAVAGDRLWRVTREGDVESLDTRSGSLVAGAGPRLAGARGIDALPCVGRVTDAPQRAPRPIGASAACGEPVAGA